MCHSKPRGYSEQLINFSNTIVLEKFVTIHKNNLLEYYKMSYLIAKTKMPYMIGCLFLTLDLSRSTYSHHFSKQNNA